MKAFIITLLTLGMITFSRTDNGRYRSEVYGNDGSYRHTPSRRYYSFFDDKYKSLSETNGKYDSIYNGYNPFFVKSLNHQLLAPYVKNENSNGQDTKVDSVTYKPTTATVSSTYQPFYYSTTPKYLAQPNYRIQYNSDRAANIVRQENDIDPNAYHFAYETDNGIVAEESGVVDTVPAGHGAGTRVRGFYEYIGDDGAKYRVDYTADENGFRPSGAHLV